MSNQNAKKLRDIIIKSLPNKEMTVYSDTPVLNYTFMPTEHSKALHPDASLVVGIRGAGKSFWWSVLQSQEHRQIIAHILPKSAITETTKISVGFGGRPSPDDYPSKDSILQLSKNFDPRQIWRTIALNQIIKQTGDNIFKPNTTWNDKVSLMIENPEKVERLLSHTDENLKKTNNYHIVLFDALDQISDDWPTMIKIIRGLLQNLLEFRYYSRIRLKAFVRPDHIADPKTTDFPDSSKLINQKVELRWPKNALYGLLWQYLGNEPDNGHLFRELCKTKFALSWNEYKNVWIPPEKLLIEEETQRDVFHKLIAGDWMGRDRRRGFPYTWLPNHLGDATGQVSPRSFLAAIRNAAEDNPRQEYEFPLYYESIKKGVVAASQIRVAEMKEDYPWADTLMKSLAGLNVPCQANEISKRWSNKKTFNKNSPEVINDLIALGIFYTMNDGRLNLPDVYRVAYGLGRKGGVKMVARK